MKKKNQTASDYFSLNLNRALRFLSFRPRSEKEIRDYFAKKKLDSITSQKIIDKLKKERFINDTEFAKWWIDQRTRVKPKGVRLIKFELGQKGISKELTDELFENNQDSDSKKAMLLAQKRMLRYKNETPQKIYEKLARFLASKGFDYDTIKEVIEKVLPKGYN